MESAFDDLDVPVRDGRVVHIRGVAPTDEAELLQAFGRMSTEARYMRFMGSVGELDVDRLRKTLAAFPESGFGIVATVPADDGIDIVGSATYFHERRSDPLRVRDHRRRQIRRCRTGDHAHDHAHPGGQAARD